MAYGPDSASQGILFGQRYHKLIRLVNFRQNPQRDFRKSLATHPNATPKLS